MNVNLKEEDVAARCKKAGVMVSALETLPSGGTHLVTVTSEGAGAMRQLLAKHLIAGKVKRFAFYHVPHSY